MNSLSKTFSFIIIVFFIRYVKFLSANPDKLILRAVLHLDLTKIVLYRTFVREFFSIIFILRYFKLTCCIRSCKKTYYY